MGSASSSGARSSSAPSGTNWRAIGSVGAALSMRATISGVIATENSLATASISASREGATSPAATSSLGDLTARDSEIGVDMRLRFAPGMRHGTLLGVPHGLRIAPQGARLIIALPWCPALAALHKLGLLELERDGAGRRVERDDVAIAHQGDRAALGGFGSDMADAEATGGAREAAIGDERHLIARPLTIERGRRCQHLAHP